MRAFFSVLDTRNYRLFFFGQLVSMTGMWMTNTASMWLVYHLSSSPTLLGLAGFCGMAPTFLIGPFAGVWVDRLDRHRLILVTQTLAMAQSFALAAYALTGTITITHIIVLNLMQGLINAFDMPARQALMAGLIGNRNNLPRAIALNSSMFNLARLLGPGIGGFLIAWVGVGVCYLIDGLSYLAVIGSILAMTVVRVLRGPARHPWHDFKEGLAYVRSHPQIRTILALLAIYAVWGVPVMVLTPIFVREILHAQANDLGLILAAEACGAVAGALWLSQRPHDLKSTWRMIIIGGLTQSTGWLCFSHTSWLPLSMLAISMIGLGGIFVVASCNGLIQTLVEDGKRGRVMSLYTVCFNGMMPIGYLIEGVLVHRIGIIATIWVKAGICFAAILIFSRWVHARIFSVVGRTHVRPEAQRVAELEQPMAS